MNTSSTIGLPTKHAQPNENDNRETVNFEACSVVNTHNICFCGEVRKIKYFLIEKGLHLDIPLCDYFRYVQLE